MYVLKQCLQFCDCLILNTNMSMLDTIDKKSHEIKQEDEIIDSIEELVEELPDTSPRYVILSYPFKLDDGRLKTPLVMLYWIPPTSGQESRMLYAGAVEQFRDKAGVSKYVLQVILLVYATFVSGK